MYELSLNIFMFTVLFIASAAELLEICR